MIEKENEWEFRKTKGTVAIVGIIALIIAIVLELP